MSKYTASSDLDYREACGDFPEDAPLCSECESADCPHATDDDARCQHEPDGDWAPAWPAVPR